MPNFPKRGCQAFVILCAITCGIPSLASGYFRPEIYSILGEGRETGFRLGRTRIHTALGLITSYDSNALYSGSNPQTDYVMQITPGVDLIRSSSKLTLSTSYRFNFRDNITENTQDDQSHIASFRSIYNFSRRLSFDLSDRFEKSSDPADVQILERLGKITNEADVSVTFKTPGNDFETTIAYKNIYQKYDDQLDQLSFLRNRVNITSKINISSRFRFLPKSVLSGQVEYGNTDFSGGSEVNGATNSDSQGVSFSAGLSSQFTRKLGLSLETGAAFLYFDAGPNSKSFTGGVKMNFQPSLQTALTLGYDRSVQISNFSNFYKEHRFTFDAVWKFFRRFEGNIKSVYDFVDFSGPNLTFAGQTRDDFIIQLIAGVSYSFTSWGKTRLEYEVNRRDSNAVDPLLGTASADFLKHKVNFGVDFYY